MNTFSYQGRNAEGKLIRGQRASSSASLLGAQLVKEGIIPTEINEKKLQANFMARFNKRFASRGKQREEMGVFARQMSILTKTGVPIIVALRQLAETARTPRTAEILNGLVEQLESGRTLASAMQEYPDYFSPIMISMVHVGQSSGRLDEAFIHLNEYLELENSAIQRATAALRYPMFVVLSIMLAVVVITGWVIPSFSGVFAQSHVALPLPTRILMGISNFFKGHGLFVITLLIGMIAGFIYYTHTPDGKYKWNHLQLRLPVIGKLLRRIIMLRFTRSFYIIANAGVPLADGLGLVAQTLENAYAIKEIVMVRDAIQHGISLTQAVSASAFFNRFEVQMLAVSEETGELASILQHIADYYERELVYDLKRLNEIVETLLVLGLGGMILILALAVYLPIWNMVNLIH